MKKVLLSIFTLSLFFIAFKSFTSSSGQGAGFSNAPSESNCTSCHSGSLNRGAFISKLNLTGNLINSGYLPDSTYNVTVSFTQPNVTKYGFQMTVLDSTNSPVGTLTNTSSRTQKRTTVIGGKTREYIEHNSSGTSTTATNFVDWTFQWKAPSAIVGKVIFYVVLNATNNSSSDQGDSIYAKTFIVQPSALMPTAKATASDTIICASKSIDFKGSGTNNVTKYFWNFPGGSPSTSTSQNPSIVYNTTGTFYAQLQTQNAFALSKVDSIKIVVKASPVATILGNSVQLMCQEDSLELSAAFSPNTTYTWSHGKKGQVVYVTDTGTYVVVASNNTGCSRTSAAVVINFHNRPSVSLVSNLTKDSACQGNTFLLTATSGFDSFYYFKNNSLIGRSISGTFNPVADTTSVYQAKVKDSKGCISLMSNPVNVKVKPLLDAPVVNCTDQTPFSVNFTWTPLPSHSGIEISSDTGKTWKAPSQGTFGQYHSVSGNPKTKFEIWTRALDISPCFQGPITKKVCETGSCNGLVYTVEYDDNVCKGEEVKVTIKNLSKQKYSISFESGPLFTDTIFSFNPTATKGYQLVVVDSNSLGCTPDKVTINIKVDMPSEVNFRSQKISDVFCNGDTVKLFANSGKDNYYFFTNNQLRLSTKDSFYYANNFNNGDTVWVIYDNGACKDTSEKKLITVVPLPIATFTWGRDTTDLSKAILNFRATNQFLPTYKYDFADGNTSVLKNTSHDFSFKSGQNLSVSLTVKDNSDCVNTSSQNIDIPTVGIQNLTGRPSGIRIYPNPATEVLNIDFKDGKPAEQVAIVDFMGNVLLDQTLEGNLSVIDISGLSSGLYMVRINFADGRSYFSKVTKY